MLTTKIKIILFFCLAFMQGIEGFCREKQYIVMNDVPPTEQGYKGVKNAFKLNNENTKKGIGVGFILYCLGNTPDQNILTLQKHLSLAVKYDMPLVIQLDVEQWWQNRPDLWNWWDNTKKGYDPANTKNVEWTGWSADSAVKIGWRNWGRQLRVLPMPNLMSSDYRAAAHQELKKIAPLIFDWWNKLPDYKKYLLLAVKVGWESAIGVNNWYYPNGNSLLNKPEANDPSYGVSHNSVPDRGVQAIGFNAAKTMGLAKKGKLKDEHITKIVSYHLKDLSKLMHEIGFPREKIFTHCGGWSEKETLFDAALNKYSCPGWSFYKYASDPTKDKSIMKSLKKNTAPYWGAVEWLLEGDNSVENWRTSITNTLSVNKVKYMCIFNWDMIKDNANSITAINEVIRK